MTINKCKAVLERLQELKEGCELVGIKSIVINILVELEDTFYMELNLEQEDEKTIEYCRNMLSGWQVSVKDILEIIDPTHNNEITILTEILKLNI